MTHTAEEVDTDWERAVVEAIRALRYGSAEIVVHAGRGVEVRDRGEVPLRRSGPPPTGHPGAGEMTSKGRAHREGGGAAPDIRRREHASRALGRGRVGR